MLAGIPAHPLVIHLAAVAVPVAATLCIVWAIRPALFTRGGRITALATTAVAAVAMLVAKTTGESLLGAMGLSEEHPGKVARHAQLADAATIAIFLLFVAVIFTFAITHPRFADKATPWMMPLSRGMLIVFGIAAIVTVILVGHAGAQLAWADFPSS